MKKTAHLTLLLSLFIANSAIANISHNCPSPEMVENYFDKKEKSFVENGVQYTFLNSFQRKLAQKSVTFQVLTNTCYYTVQGGPGLALKINAPIEKDNTNGAWEVGPYGEYCDKSFQACRFKLKI